MKSSSRTPLRRRSHAALDELARAANAGCPTEELLARGLSLVLGVTRLPAGIACLCPAGEETPTVVETRGLRPATARAIKGALPLAVPNDLLVAELPRLPVPPATRDRLGAHGISRGVVVPLLSTRGPSGALVGLGRGRAAVRAPRTLLRSITLELGSAVGRRLFLQGLQAARLWPYASDRARSTRHGSGRSSRTIRCRPEREGGEARNAALAPSLGRESAGRRMGCAGRRASRSPPPSLERPPVARRGVLGSRRARDRPGRAPAPTRSVAGNSSGATCVARRKARE